MRKSFLCSIALLAATVLLYPLPARTVAAAHARPQSKKKVTVPVGTRILVRTVDAIDSSKQKTGYRFYRHARNQSRR